VLSFIAVSCESLSYDACVGNLYKQQNILLFYAEVMELA